MKIWIFSLGPYSNFSPSFVQTQTKTRKSGRRPWTIRAEGPDEIPIESSSRISCGSFKVTFASSSPAPPHLTAPPAAWISPSRVARISARGANHNAFLLAPIRSLYFPSYQIQIATNLLENIYRTNDFWPGFCYPFQTSRELGIGLRKIAVPLVPHPDFCWAIIRTVIAVETKDNDGNVVWEIWGLPRTLVHVLGIPVCLNFRLFLWFLWFVTPICGWSWQYR